MCNRKTVTFQNEIYQRTTGSSIEKHIECISTIASFLVISPIAYIIYVLSMYVYQPPFNFQWNYKLSIPVE